MCVYDEHQELVGIPTKSWLEYTMTQQARAGRNTSNEEKVPDALIQHQSSH